MEEIYKIIKIIDNESVVINAGSENYIENGDKFRIYTIGEEVKDLDGKNLGTLDTIKAILTVVTVFPKMCICQKITKVPSIYAKLGGQFIAEEKALELNVNQAEITGGIQKDLTIHIGDLAKIEK